MAFTELGSDVHSTEESADASETAAQVETEAETEETESTEESTEETTEEESEEDNVPAVKIAVASAAPVKAAVKPAAGNVIPPLKKPHSGWSFLERGAPDSFNATDMYTIAYDRLKCGMWSATNISLNYPVAQFSYVLVGGAGARAGLFQPVTHALGTYGVPGFAIQQANLNFAGSTLGSARKLFKLVNATYYAKAEQPIILVVHSNAIVPVHAYLALYPEAASQVHAVLAYNPIWGGSVIADNIAGLPADVQKIAASQGVTAATAKDITYKSRQEMIRSFPLDFNSFRVVVAATHLQASKEFLPSLQYLRKYSKSISDGVITLQDQLIPGARAVVLDKLDHDDLVYATPATSPVNSTVAAQAMIYTLFKLTP